jgi:hypothetical protein
MAQRTASTTLLNSTRSSVAGSFHHAPPVDGDGWIDHVTSQRSQPRQRAILIDASQAAVSHHICGENCDDLALHLVARHPPTLPGWAKKGKCYGKSDDKAMTIYL